MRQLLAVVLIAASLCHVGSAQELTGKQLVHSMLANFPQKDFLCQARLSFSTDSNEERNVDVQLQTRNRSEAISTVVVVSAPTNLEGNAALSVFRRDGTQAIYRKTPGSKEAQPLKGNELRSAFAGTDFAFEDLDFGFLRWPEHKLVGERRRQTRDCYVIESTPARGQSAQYGKVVSWIDKENLMLMLAEGYDPDGKLVKAFDIRALKRFEGGWFIKTMNLKNIAANRQTKLEVTQFEHALNLDDRFFAPESFGRIAAFKFPQGTKNY